VALVISADSRYSTSTITTVQTASGPRQTVVIPDPAEKVIAYTNYLVRDGDRIDQLAFRFLGLAKLWWMIADANPEIHDWFVLPRGTLLRIPSV
jgi:phage tail protein X